MTEAYTAGGDAWQTCRFPEMGGQTFRPTRTHTLHYVDLQLWGDILVGQINVRIFYADSRHKPTGDMISDSYGFTPAGLYPFIPTRCRIKMRPVELIQGEYYCIVLHSDGTLPYTGIQWRFDTAEATYWGGMRVFSANGGTNWTVHYDSDFIFAEFGCPPGLDVPIKPPIDKFVPTIFDHTDFDTGVCIGLATNSPTHMTLYWTDIEPRKHPVTRVVRGLVVPWYTYFCFVAWRAVEQLEPGDTLYHSFSLSGWPKATGYAYFFDPATGNFPPWWEPWGTTLTQNWPWTQAFPSDPISYSLSAGILTLDNPTGALSGITVIPPWQTPVMLVDKGKPLCFSAKSLEAIITNPDDFTAIHLLLTFQLEDVHIEFIINRGSVWGSWPQPDKIIGENYWIDYGLEPKPVNVLELWKAVRLSLGKSLDPTGWEVIFMSDLLEHTTNPTSMNHVVDYIHLYHPAAQSLTSGGSTRWMVGRGDVDGALSPSVTPVFSYTFKGGRPATNTLRPVAQGDECRIPWTNYLDCPNHFQTVNQVIPDGDARMMWAGDPNNRGAYLDLYIPTRPLCGAGNIEKLVLHYSCRGHGRYPFQGQGRPAVKIGGTVYYGSYWLDSTDTWRWFSHTFPTNPDSGLPWTWYDLNTFQFGMELRGDWRSGYHQHSFFCNLFAFIYH